MTEEIGYILLRTEVEPWATVSKFVLVMCFIAPFGMLLSRGLKKTPTSYKIVACIIASGLWLNMLNLVQPPLNVSDVLNLGFIELGMAVGFLGGLILVHTKFMSEVPAIPVTDPFLHDNPMDIHVHPSHAH